mmetsp:Transcript_30603/g.97893  ORF Transcript_30603/g.97893 Transcript_30603/m.97893 type:complete len:238 (+) Transcript_30603:56-769(+)
MWTSFGCTCGRTFTPIIYEAGSVHMDQHIFDQWSVSHAIWGFVLGSAYTAPVAAWRVGLLFVLWELWENVVEVAFSTYAPGEYHGDSFVNSVFDMVPSVTGVLLGRHAPRAWPLVALAELIATRHGFGVHSVFLGHQGSICDLRTEPLECGKAYALRLLLLPWLFCKLEPRAWRAYCGWTAQRHSKCAEGGGSPSKSPRTPSPCRARAGDNTPEKALKALARRRPPVEGAPPDGFKL